MYNIYAFFIRFSCVIGKMIVKKVFINVSLFFLFFLCSLSVYVIIYIFERYKSRCCALVKMRLFVSRRMAMVPGISFQRFVFNFFFASQSAKFAKNQVQTQKETGSIL
jgi:hypothetical protein